jgi:uncharacterized membrane protein YphA (DoxX/SURF4 family)
MHLVAIVIQLFIALGLLNVWLVQSGRSTPYRGGDAVTLKGEFLVYGLPGWAVYLVGFLKIVAALALIVGIWLPALVFPAVVVIGVLMVGAIAMHVRVSDPLKKSIPALIMLVLCVLRVLMRGI